jgi:cyanophycinase
MAVEKQRLQAWLEQPANAQLIHDDFRNVRRFHQDENGPTARGNLAWYPRLIKVDGKRGNGAWEPRYSEGTLAASTVPAYDEKDWNNGIVPDHILKLPAEKQFLVEFIALNMKETHFEGKDLDPDLFGAGNAPGGGIGVNYAFDAAHAGAYADWSDHNKGKASAIVLNGIVKSAPTFQGKITGTGIITGDFTIGEVDELVKVLKMGSLRVEPVLLSKESIGPMRRDDPFRAMMKRLGASDVRELDCSHPREVTKQKLAVLDDATAVWFGGGRQWRLVDAFDGTPAIAAFHAVLARGGVIGGTSAGATIQGDFLVRGSPLGNTEMWCEGYDRGFAFLPGVAIDQHFLARKREGDLAGLIAKVPMVIGLGIDEGTAAIVRGSVLEVLGDSKVAVFDARKDRARTAPEWLAPGERWDLAAARRP